jgi:tetratricopeptide (TPR) repeat protein
VIRQIFFANFVFLCVFATEGQAKTINHEEQYKACMELVQTHPNDAFDAGLAWQGLGGGEAAEHCIASALIRLKSYKIGAQRLEELADKSRRSKEFKAQLLAQSAQGWFLANEFDHARAVLTKAIELDDTQVEFYVDRAQVLAALHADTDAIEDLDQALHLDNVHVDALVFRGSLNRQLGKFEDAWADINLAVELDPENQEAQLEKGMLYRIKGNTDQARSTWLEAIEIAPKSQTAEMVRRNLENMDVKKDQ